MHRNLRADNIFVTGNAYQPLVKISGFGYSKDVAMDSIAVPRVLLALPPCNLHTVDICYAMQSIRNHMMPASGHVLTCTDMY